MSYSVHYVEKVRSTDYPSYYSNLHACMVLASNFLAQNIFTSIGKSEQELSIQTQTTINESRQNINNLQATFGTSIGLDDTETREKVWRMFFKDKPLPQIRTDAVKEYYGALDKYVDWKKIDTKKLKKKIDKFLDE